MKILAQIKYCNNIIKILVKVPTTAPHTTAPHTTTSNTTNIPTTTSNTTNIPTITSNTTTSNTTTSNTTNIPTTTSNTTAPIITKSVSYHNIYKNFNLEEYIKDEKKYIKKMVKYYNQ